MARSDDFSSELPFLDGDIRQIMDGGCVRKTPDAGSSFWDAVAEGMRRSPPDEEPLLHVDTRRLRPSDIIVVRCRGKLTKANIERIRRGLMLAFPEHQIVVLEDGWDLSIVRAPSEHA